jgi:MoaA/NifB/PqqE/SkfB family radical SAM enzyme
MEIFDAALKWVKYFSEMKTQKELNLFGIGEPLLNPKIIDMVQKAREVLPINNPVHINTNGLLLTDVLAWELRRAGITGIDVTGHDHYHTAQAIRILKKHRIPYRLSYDFVLNPNNWAGQVNWFASDVYYLCPWLHRGQLTIQSNGDITICCIDAFATGKIGNIMETDLTTIDIKPFELCRKCHQLVPQQERNILIA